MGSTPPLRGWVSLPQVFQKQTDHLPKQKNQNDGNNCIRIPRTPTSEAKKAVMFFPGPETHRSNDHLMSLMRAVKTTEGSEGNKGMEISDSGDER